MVFDGVAYALVEALPTTPVAPGWATLGGFSVAVSARATSTDGARIYSSHGVTSSVNAGLSVIAADGSVLNGPSATVPRFGVAGAFCNGKHYAIGGTDNNNVGQPIVEAYTPAGANGASGVWSVGASAPTALTYSSAAVVGNSIYLAGGQTVDTPAIAKATLYRYDTAANTWATLSSMPAARTQGAMVAYSGKLYYLGGVDSSGAGRNQLFVYDIAAGTWSTNPVGSNDVAGSAAATVIGSSIYAWTNTQVTHFNLADNTQGPLAVQPAVGHGGYPGVVSIGSALYLVSGSGTANVDRIDVNASGSFGASVQAVQAVTALAGGAAAGVAFALPTTIPTAPGWATVGIVPETYRYDAAVSSDGTRAYVSHGYHQGTATNNEMTFSAFTVTADGSFAIMPNSPTARHGAVGAFCNGKHYAIGGLFSNDATTSLVEAYVPAGANGASGVWSTVAGNAALAYQSAAVVGNFVYTAGGQLGPQPSSGISAGLYRYDTTANTWTTLATMPSPSTQGAMVAYSGKLYYFGGQYGSSMQPTVFIYDIAAGTWSTGTPLVGSFSIGGATVIGSTAYLYGQYNGGTPYRTITYNLTTGASAVYAQQTSKEHAVFAGVTSIGSALYIISGAAISGIERIDTTSGLTAYQANLALLKALVAA